MQNSGTAGHRGVKLNPWKDLELNAQGGSTTGIINPEKDLCSRILSHQSPGAGEAGTQLRDVQRMPPPPFGVT